MDQQNITIDFSSKRSKQAKLHPLLAGKAFNTALMIMVLILLLGGLSMVLIMGSIGWVIAGLSGPVYVLARWGEYLRKLPPSKGPTIDAVLDVEILAKLPKQHSPKDIAKVISGMPSSNFIGNRFTMSVQYIQDIASTDPQMSAQVWQLARQYQSRFGFKTINAGILLVSIAHTTEALDDYLAHLGLEKSDLLEGLAWYKHIEDVIEDQVNKRSKGGIGRDWAFGYVPLLDRLGFNISEHVMYGGSLVREVESRENAVRQLAQTLTQAGRRNVALVGQLGSGKTKIVHTFAERLVNASADMPQSLHYHQVIALDPSTLMSRARGRGELEALVQNICYEALSAKNIVLFLDDAQLFFEEGTGSVDLSNVLMPILEGGALRIILAMDEQRWVRIVQNNAALAQSLNRIMVAPVDKFETMQIMQNQALKFENQQKTIYTYQALQAAYSLSERFMSEQVMPGKALKLLEAASTFNSDLFVTKESVERAIEQTQGVKVSTANSAEERDTLLNLEDLIHQRMINQSRAVKVVSDALRRARAGVRNTSRPIGTFLFLGPTGVGKTELAKSVAAVFFGDESNIVRLDLNEYVRPEDVSRLIADASSDSHSLTAQISRQPFSVVLLDEIEKAHPEVLNTLLQLLDEGVLRDINNREVSFRDAVIIATSNAGADKIRAHIEAGEQLEQFEQQFTDELINSNIFRPEFLNRYDEIVLFTPLKREELLQVIDLIIRGVNKTLADQKLSVVVDDEAKQLLVDAGYDPRLGARPMRRVVQRTVENIVANLVLSQQARPGSQITVTADQIREALNN